MLMFFNLNNDTSHLRLKEAGAEIACINLLLLILCTFGWVPPAINKLSKSWCVVLVILKNPLKTNRISKLYTVHFKSYQDYFFAKWLNYTWLKHISANVIFHVSYMQSREREVCQLKTQKEHDHTWKRFLSAYPHLLSAIKQMGKCWSRSSVLGVHLRTNSPEMILSFVMFRGPLIMRFWTL